MTDEGKFRITVVALEDELLFDLTRQSISERQQNAITALCCDERIDWDLVYSNSEAHRVAPLVYHNLLRCAGVGLKIPESVSDKFERCLVYNVAWTAAVENIICEVLAFFNRRGIDVMLIKGAAMNASVYSQSWYTTADDIDLIIRPRREDVSEKEHLEIVAFIERFPILECDYFEHHDISMTGALPISFQRIWDDATRTVYKGQDVFLMSPEDMLLSACINSCRKRFFRLKSLLDIAEIINKYGGLKWGELESRAREYECNNIVYAALLTTRMALGCGLPEDVLNELAISRVRMAVINYLSRQMSLSSLASLYCGKNIFSKKVSPSLLLPYCTYRWKHMKRVIEVAYSQRNKSRDA